MEETCFHCNGEGENFVHIHYAHGPGVWRRLRCQICDGAGVVSQALAEAFVEGTRRRDIRVAARLSQREMAERLGVTTQAYSQMEHGGREWPVGSAAHFEALAAQEATTQ